jgi:hypothetical protein
MQDTSMMERGVRVPGAALAVVPGD